MDEPWEHISVYWEQDKFHKELLHVLDASFERGPQSLRATPPTTIMPSVLNTRPLPVRL